MALSCPVGTRVGSPTGIKGKSDDACCPLVSQGEYADDNRLTDGQTDGHHTVTLSFSLDAASVISLEPILKRGVVSVIVVHLPHRCIYLLGTNAISRHQMSCSQCIASLAPPLDQAAFLTEKQIVLLRARDSVTEITTHHAFAAAAIKQCQINLYWAFDAPWCYWQVQLLTFQTSRSVTMLCRSF